MFDESVQCPYCSEAAKTKDDYCHHCGRYIGGLEADVEEKATHEMGQGQQELAVLLRETNSRLLSTDKMIESALQAMNERLASIDLWLRETNERLTGIDTWLLENDKRLKNIATAANLFVIMIALSILGGCCAILSGVPGF